MTTNRCGSSHDPAPYLLHAPEPSTPPVWRFAPNPGYCQNRDCYEPQLALDERTS